MSNDRRTRADREKAKAEAAATEPPKRRALGPYLVPLHLNGPSIKELEPSERDIAALRYSHWVSMFHRNPMGFRRDRTSKHNKGASPLAMILNGMKLVARHGNPLPGSGL